MKNICICFQVHHPFHFQQFRHSDIGGSRPYYDDWRIESEINDAAMNYYLPSNQFLLKLLQRYKENLKFTFYISGTAMDQFLLYEPEVLASFRTLAETGQVDFLGSTSSHSLVTLTNHKRELIQQVKDHRLKTEYLFGVKPRVFVNTDLMYSDLMGKDVAEAGYRAVVTNGTKKTLAWRSPNYVYSNPLKPKMEVYFRNEHISNELAVQLKSIENTGRSLNTNWMFSLITNSHQEEPILNIYLDYKELGGFSREKKFQYLDALIAQIEASPRMNFIAASDIAEQLGAVAVISAPEPICWVEGFHSYYYPGNELQVEAIKQLYLLQSTVGRIDDLNLKSDWDYLQTSDHIHLMDEQHPQYQQHADKRMFQTKYDAFINFMNLLDDFRLKLQVEIGKEEKKQVRRREPAKSRK